MEILFILIPVAIFLTLLASALYIWAISSGQYDDLKKESESILYDDIEKKENNTPEEKKQ